MRVRWEYNELPLEEHRQDQTTFKRDLLEEHMRLKGFHYDEETGYWDGPVFKPHLLRTILKKGFGLFKTFTHQEG